jgi:uncharacterized protein (TIGR03790 family)
VARILLPVLALAAAAFAQSPASVLVVVNRNSPVSRRIADYYAFRRSIPRGNVCKIDAPDRETISRAVYDRTVAAPIAACLKSRRLVETVLYIATTLGVPLRIENTSGQGADRDEAAVDSELAALYADLHGARHGLNGPMRNPFFGRVDQRFRHPEVPIYLVCRLAAYDFDGVKGMIDRSLEAMNRGRVVLDMKSNTDAEGDNWLRQAAARLPEGRVVLDDSTRVIEGERDVIGYAGWGSNDPNRKQRFLRFQWLPGAIATEYVSSDGRTLARPPDDWNTTTCKDPAHFFAGSPQSLSADYLLEGAAGVSGHVAEPYLAFTPRPNILFPAYLGGRTLAESFYLAIPAVSWQNIVLGDPLCRLR